MSHGRPDFTSSINITGQDLLEVIERPKYGAAENAAYSASIAENDSATLFSVAGTGMIYGGSIYHSGAFDTDYVFLRAVIDGEDMPIFSIKIFNTWMIDEELMSILTEKYYSEENDKYIHRIARGITFETSFAIRLFNDLGSGAADYVVGELYFALI